MTRATLARAFFTAAAVTIPWTAYLAVTLPSHYSAHHYWLGWSGFNAALVVVLVVTGRSLLRSDFAVHRYAAVAATMLTVDAWFDVLNAATKADKLVAAGMAALVELPLAYVCWRIACSDLGAEPLTPKRRAGAGRGSRPRTR